MATLNRTAGSVDFNASAYWGGSSPASNDTLIIAVGADPFSTNVDQSAKDFLAVTFDTGYGDQSTVIGSAASPLRFDCNQTGAGIVTFAGACAELNLQAGTGGTIATLKFRPRNSNSRMNLGASTISTRMELEGGRSNIGQTVTLSGTTIIYEGSHRVERHGAGTNAPSITLVGGQLIMERDWTTLTVMGGELVIDLDDGSVGGAVNIYGGKCRHVRGSAASVEAFAGTYDRSVIAKPYTVSDLKMHPNATEVLERGALKATISARTDYGKGPKKVV